MTSFRRHLTYANVVATLALIVAVAGGSTAIAISAKKNSVGTKALKNHSVTAKKLALGAVGSDQLANGSVTASKLTGINLVKASASPPSSAHTVAGCGPGEKLLSGGFDAVGDATHAAIVHSSLPSSVFMDAPIPGWEMFAGTESGGSITQADSYALCLKATPGG